MSQNEERKKVKPRRFNKSEQPSFIQPPTNLHNVRKETNYQPKRGFKRPNSESTSSSGKRPCYGLMHPPTNVVNLANNRMKKLKQNLKTAGGPSIYTNGGSEQKANINSLDSQIILPQNIYNNGKDGQANQRMNRLKKVINENSDVPYPKFNDSSGSTNFPRVLIPHKQFPTSSHSSQESSSTSAQPYKSEYYSEYSQQFGSNKQNETAHISPLFKDQSNSYDNGLQNYSKNIFSNSNDLKNERVGLSSRILKIKRNTEEINNFIQDDKSPKPNNNNIKLPLKIDNTELNYLERRDTSKNFNSSSSLFANLNKAQRTPISDRLKVNRNSTSQAITYNRHILDVDLQIASKHISPLTLNTNLVSPTNSEESKPTVSICSFKNSTPSLSPTVTQSFFTSPLHTAIGTPKNTKEKTRLKLNRNLLATTPNSNSVISPSPVDKSNKNSNNKVLKSSTSISDRLKINRATILSTCANLNTNQKRFPLKSPSSSSTLEKFNFKEVNSPCSEPNLVSHNHSPIISKTSCKTDSTQKSPISPSDCITLARQTSLKSPSSSTPKKFNFKTPYSPHTEPNLISKNNSPTISKTSSKTASTQNSHISPSDRLKIARQTPLKSPHFKEPSKTLLTENSLSPFKNALPDTEQVEYVDKIVYDEKMKMTATWVRSHQQFVDNSTAMSPELSETRMSDVDSLHVTLSTSEIERMKNFDTSEEMEWTNAEPDNEILETGGNQSQDSSTTQETKIQKPKKHEKDKNLCIVVDTNIFISELSKLTDIINLKILGPVQPVLYIPWMVITELDEMKDRSRDPKLKQKSFNAIKFINKALSEENPRIKGQTISDMGHQNHVGASPDDKIMGTCLQALQKYESVILLSNDVNLKNKALINNILVASANDVIMKIMSKLKKTTKTQKVMLKMSILYSEMICVSAKEAYGDVWTKMDMLSNPPWSLLECLKRFKKYWIAVFAEKLMKQFLPAVEKLLKFLEYKKDICDDSTEYKEFVDSCMTICIFLKDIEEHRATVEKTMYDVTKI